MSITYHRINLEDVIAGLKDFLSERPDILIAFIFGSATRRNLVRDLDIAVYFRGVSDPMEVCRLIVELEDSIGLPVDVIPLNEASPKLLLKIISNGFVITIKDMGLLIKLIKIALTEVMDIELKLKFMHGSKETS